MSIYLEQAFSVWKRKRLVRNGCKMEHESMPLYRRVTHSARSSLISLGWLELTTANKRPAMYRRLVSTVEK